MAKVEHRGGCHCGAVRFVCKAPETLVYVDCNCSICTKKQNRHFIVPHEDFTLQKGSDSLTTYTFGSHQAKHIFCKVCGVQSFYQPRSNPSGYGIMPHCLDPGTVKETRFYQYDGQNWEQFMEAEKAKADGQLSILTFSEKK